MSNIQMISALSKSETKLCGYLFEFVDGKKIPKTKLETALEWFITWRIKLETMKSPFWCDGTSKLQVALDDVNIISIQGDIRVGPESDVMNVYEGQFDASFTLGVNSLQFVSYSIFIYANGVTYTLESGI